MSTDVISWSQTAASNASADSNINFAEGMAPSAVNDSARALMAAVAKFRDDLGATKTLGGGTTAYTLTSNQGMTALTDGMRVSFIVNSTNTGNCTLAVNGLTAKSLLLKTIQMGQG